MNGKKEEVPLLLFFLENDKIGELVRLMFNRKVAEEYLLDYGEPVESKMRRGEEARLEDYVRRLQVQDIVHLKGSQRDQVKYYCNTYLQEFFIRKLKVCKFNSDDRKLAWMQLTEIFQLQNLYEGLEELELPTEIHSTIMKDVLRTYISPELHIKDSPSDKERLQKEMRQNLQQVLSRFSLYNPYIGYCQGMNTISLFFFEEGFSNEQNFFILKKITEEKLPCDYYSSMDSVIAYVRILFEILHYTHPRVVRHMKHIMMTMEQDGFMMTMSFVFQWFICLFTNVNLKRNIRLIVMDYFLIEGITVLFKAALGYFDVIEKSILSARTFEQYIPTVQRIISEFESENEMRLRLNDTYMNGRVLQLLKQKLMTKSGGRREKQEKTSCNYRWNTCLQYIQNNIAQGNKQEFFVFKTKEKIKVVDNYLQKIQNHYFKICKIVDKSDNLRVGRMIHVCRENSLSSKTQDEDARSDRKLSGSGYSESAHKSAHSSGHRELSPVRLQNVQRKLLQPGRRELIRTKAMQNLQASLPSRKSVLNHSQSVKFMRNMIQNESFSNLLEILQVDEMENLFKDDISEDD